METINYQGQQIEAELVNYLSGVIPTSTVDMEGDERLYRDTQGRYYLQRELNWLSVNEEDGRGEREASGRTLIHRINVNAAILWATTRLNSETGHLRVDAASLLMENRGYTDPFPLNMNAAKRATPQHVPPPLRVDGPLSSVTTEGWFQGCIQPEEGSGARVSTIFDLDPLHAALLKVFIERHDINVAVLMRACLVYELEDMFDMLANSGEEEEAAVRCLSKYGRLTPARQDFEVRDMAKAAGPDPESFTPLPTTPKTTSEASVDHALLELLDENALAMLHRAVHEKPTYSVADYVNAGVLFMLARDEDDKEAGESFCESNVCMKTAKALRLEAEKNAPQTARVAPSVNLEEPALVQAEDAGAVVYQATFDIEPTANRCGWRSVIQTTEAQFAEVSTLAKHYDLRPREFLRQLVSYQLPAQARGLPKSQTVAFRLESEHINFACLEPELAMRIERTAKLRGFSVNELVAESIAGTVDCYEENMLVHPATGELLHDDFEELYTEIERKITAAPIGKEMEPHWLRTLAPKAIAPSKLLELPLDKETSEWLTGYARETARDVVDVVAACVEYSKDFQRHTPNGEEEWNVFADLVAEAAKRRAAAGKDVGATAINGSSNLVVALDAEASALVRQYLEITPRAYTAQDIVSGAVANNLEEAIRDSDSADYTDGLASEEYGDTTWGIVDEAIDDAFERRTGSRADLTDPDDERIVPGSERARTKGDEAEINGAVEHMRKRLGDNPAPGTRGTAPKQDAEKPLFLLNAPKPRLPKE